MERRQPRLSARLQGFGTTIFAEMTALAVRANAVNLGQGFPDDDAPEHVKEAAIRAIRDGRNQYAPGIGVPALREAVAGHQSRFWGLEYDPDSEVTITAGATEAIFSAIQALCDVGDEVITFEPYYDSYLASIAMAGAVARVVTLRPPDYACDPDELERLVSPRTRLLVLNSPHNPTGKVFGRDELEQIARICRERDLIAVTDEVYEHLVYTGEHVPLASLPGMRERTVTISSAAKTFSVTGWKTGWVCAPPDLTRAVRTAKQFVTFTNGTPFQFAVSEALASPDGFFSDLVASYRRRRDTLCRGLEEVGFDVFAPDGTYFVVVDIRPLGFDDDVEFCLALPEKFGVVAVPTSVFYTEAERGRHLVRFTFCKSDAVIEEGLTRLQALRA
ncbi:MAG: pyridoxal phosphate-dependent aminotransferase [Nitriliruptorales bacterium]